MPYLKNEIPAVISVMTDIEDRLAATLTSAADQIAHTECFDDEQRSEVYTIIEALKADSETHRVMVSELGLYVSQERCDA